MLHPHLETILKALTHMNEDYRQLYIWLGPVEHEKMIARVDAALSAVRAMQAGAPVPDWTSAPAWAMWWAVDADGSAMWYKPEPQLYKLGWTVNGWYGKDYLEANLVSIPLGIDYRALKQQRPASGQEG